MKKHFIGAMYCPTFITAPYCDQELQTSKEIVNLEGKVNRIVVFGCGGHASSIINTILETSDVKDILVVDKNLKIGEIILGCATMREYVLHENDVFIVAVGDNNRRKNLYTDLKKCSTGCSISIVSRFAKIGLQGEIGSGTFVAPYAYIGPKTKVGNNTIINTGSIIEHETVIGDHTHIAPHATICGRSRVGNNVFCGAGSTIIDKISICDDVVIGAGTVVINNIYERGTYIGVPARKINGRII